MAKRTRYQLMPASKTQRSSNDLRFPDPLMLPLHRFQATERGQRYTVTQGDIDRFDLLISRYYGTADYDDMVLWLNGKGAPLELSSGEEITLPSKRDLERFYVRYRVGENREL